MLPPAAQISIKSVEVADDIVTMNVDVTDPEYALRGFQPVNFRLAGEKYPEMRDSSAIVASVPEKVLSPAVTADVPDLRFYVPPSTEPVQLTMIFKASRSGEALTALQDLYLFYRHAKIERVQFNAPRAAALPGF